MKVHFTGRHVDVSEPLKATARERLLKMTTYLDDIIDVHVIFSVDSHHQHLAEVTLKTRRGAFVASSKTADMYKSIAEALDKLDAQAHKVHDRKVSRDRVSLRALAPVEAQAE
jgi:putative sigma-54 modulation protein